MRILVNYDSSESSHLSILQYHIKNRGMEAIATSSILNIGELIDKAKAAKCTGIFLCNAGTLANLVPNSKPSLDDYRGSRLNYDIPVVVGNSLLHAHSVDHGAWLLGKDLEKFKQANKPAERFEYTVLALEDFAKAKAFLDECILIAYDIETSTAKETETDLEKEMPTVGDTVITCCSWTGLHPQGGIKTFVLPLIDFGIDHWHTDLAYVEAITLMREINANKVPKVMHNGMYDCTHSIVYNAEPNNYILDTMALAHAEYVSLPKSLDFVASLHLFDYIQWKNESEEASKQKDINRYWAYNAKDTFSTLRICIEQLRNMPPYARKNYANQFPLVYPALYCSFEGFKIDKDKRNELREKHKTKLEEALSVIRIMTADKDFNPGSPKQVAFVIYDVFGAADPHIGWRKDAKTKKKTKMVRGTDEKNMKAVGEQHPILLRLTDSIIAYREAQKAIGTYFDFSTKQERLLWSLNPFGTETGRMACNSSSFWCGTQVQNIPSYAKGMLCADEGFELFEADKSQSEARCTAYLSQETNLITALETPGRDFYKSLGTLFFAIPYPEVTTDFRNLVLKKIVHGTNYMMGAPTFIDNAGVQNILTGAAILNVKITLSAKPAAGEETLKSFATSLLESYHKPFPRIRQWYQEVKNEIRTTHMLVSPLGHTRYFFGDIDKKYQIFASGVAHGPQNLSVSILNIGFWNVWVLQKKNPKDMRLKAQVHDSALGQTRKDKKGKELQIAILNALDTTVVIHNRSLRIPNDMSVGETWDKKTMKKLEVGV